MNIQEMLTSDKPMVLPADVAPIIGSDPQYIRYVAKHTPEVLGFPVTVIGSRVKIPRIPFLKYLGYCKEDKERES